MWRKVLETTPRDLPTADRPVYDPHRYRLGEVSNCAQDDSQRVFHEEGTQEDPSEGPGVKDLREGTNLKIVRRQGALDPRQEEKPTSEEDDRSVRKGEGLKGEHLHSLKARL